MSNILNHLLFCLLLLTSSFSAKSQKNTAALLKKMQESANEYQMSHNYDSAIYMYNQIAALQEKNNNWRGYLLAKIRSADNYQKQFKLEQVVKLLKPAILEASKHIDPYDTTLAMAFKKLGFPYVYRSMFDSTLYYWEKSLNILSQTLGKSHIEVAYLYNDMGLIYWYKSEYDTSLALYLKSIEIQKKHDEWAPNLSRTYINVGNTYKNLSDYDAAKDYYFKALTVQKKIFDGNHTDIARTYNNLGVIYQKFSDFDQALEYYFKSLDIYEKQKEKPLKDLSMTYNNIGIIYASKMEYDKALDYQFKSLDIKKQLWQEDKPTVAMNYNNIGNIYLNKKNHDKALEFMNKGLRIQERLLGKNHTEVAVTLSNIGTIHFEKEQGLDTAQLFFEKSLEIRKHLFGEKHSGIAIVYDHLGKVYEKKGQNEDALRYYLKSLNIRKEIFGNKHVDIAHSYYNIGKLYESINQKKDALISFHKGIAASLKNFYDTTDFLSVPVIDDFFDYQWLLKNLHAKASLLSNNPNIAGIPKYQGRQVALLHFFACDTLIQEARQKITKTSDKLTLGEISNKIYIDAALNCIYLSETKSKKAANNYRFQAFVFSEKNKASTLLESLAGSEAMRFSGIPDSLVEKEHQLKISMSFYKKTLSEHLDTKREMLIRQKLFDANYSYDSLIKFFENNYPKYHQLKYGRNLATVNQIQEILDENTAIISFLETKIEIIIFYVSSEKFNIYRKEKNTDFRHMVDEYRELLTTPGSDKTEFAILSNKLYNQLLPFDYDKKIEHLLVIPAGEISLIPFETLLTKKNSGNNTHWDQYPYLLMEQNISYAYSANLFFQTFSKEPSEKIEFTQLHDWLAVAPVFNRESTNKVTLRTRSIMEELNGVLTDSALTRGNIFSGQHIVALPGTESEVKTIFDFFEQKNKNAVANLHESASEDFVKRGSLHKYKYLHFASHGIVNTEKPELSGIILAQDSTSKEDGILHTGEMYNLKLNADLTVLSACETGLGKIKKGEGLIGLTRALLYAGSKNIIVSLWKVADKSTKQLMVDFYADMLENENKPDYAKSLQKAKLKMIAEKKYAHPFYWSPFILIGK